MEMGCLDPLCLSNGGISRRQLSSVVSITTDIRDFCVHRIEELVRDGERRWLDMGIQTRPRYVCTLYTGPMDGPPPMRMSLF